MKSDIVNADSVLRAMTLNPFFWIRLPKAIAIGHASVQTSATMKALLVAVALALPSIGAYAGGPTYSELDAQWSADLAAKRAFVASLAERHYKYWLTGTRKDLEVLQRIVDDKLIRVSDKTGLQALGVVFGDVTGPHINAEWKQVRDDDGESPVLKIRGRRAAIAALTIISKRIEDHPTLNVTALHDNLVNDVKRLSAEFGTDGLQ